MQLRRNNYVPKVKKKKCVHAYIFVCASLLMAKYVYIKVISKEVNNLYVYVNL